MENKIKKVQRRDGTLVDFKKEKISEAVFKAVTSTGQGDGIISKKVTEKVIQILERRFKKEEIPTVEQIQDIVEEILIIEGLVETAKAYILYREQRRKIRETGEVIDESSEKVDSYLKEIDWQVNENANMTFSLQGLNQYVGSYISKKYWLNKIYPKEVREAAANEDFHIHNLELLAPYCAGWDLQDFLKKGFGGVSSKLECRPPKHFRTALGQLVNVLFTLQGETAGANAVSNFDTLLAPFIRHDNLNYPQVKQAIQEFLYNCMVPTRVGFQTPFLNVSLDINPPKTLKDVPVIIGGEPQKETYGEFQEEMNMFNKAFYEGLMEGDAKGRPFTFPIPTVSITKDFNWDNPTLKPLWEATAKYGINYFSNFIQSDMSPDDARSMCCRLRLDNRELLKRGGGLFGSNPLTGSIGVVTINMPRIGYLSKTKKEFFERLERLMDIAKESLEIKRKAIENFMEKGLYPYSRYYLSDVKKMRGSYFGNHFSTIGIMGVNEALLNFLDEDIASKKGRKFAVEVLTFMREILVKFQKETGNLYNLEATPGEGTSYRQARADKKKYPDIITAGTKEVPYYTNSTHLPVGYTDDAFEALKLQDELQSQYTGGTVLHLFLGEKIDNPESAKMFVKKVFEKFHLPYITLTPTFSVCPVHGYISGEHFTCPKCAIKQPCEVYSRIVGYIRPVQQWNHGKKQEFKERKEYKNKV
ncbi:MAG: ribonucleoside triphosphate reductase [Candidatus Pacebacteria bacterium]|jgi:ribonucleoside-triphosphate reductase|nr:ribonucleoside triphosphate reductase [Candidatus Paceibacterota bacterium]MDD3072343.1 ribonucleoside triphosphate reductase [Candidatus Paceibacterota bacterium]MDD3728727.1 ribonucleoside triphosphate reductase [Candidatus Paceibacterota bacterium]MDD4201415.1 ribonucleoside triphosphate reductase [Candidatus Paceibacterota bacterium]MDD4466854.1 ribonucleoside triphosphate reductase [Candidatus Paceibacterota bacterium]